VRGAASWGKEEWGRGSPFYGDAENGARWRLGRAGLGPRRRVERGREEARSRVRGHGARGERLTRRTARVAAAERVVRAGVALSANGDARCAGVLRRADARVVRGRGAGRSGMRGVSGSPRVVRAACACVAARGARRHGTAAGWLRVHGLGRARGVARLARVAWWRSEGAGLGRACARRAWLGGSVGWRRRWS